MRGKQAGRDDETPRGGDRREARRVEAKISPRGGGDERGREKPELVTTKRRKRTRNARAGDDEGGQEMPIGDGKPEGWRGDGKPEGSRWTRGGGGEEKERAMINLWVEVAKATISLSKYQPEGWRWTRIE